MLYGLENFLNMNKLALIGKNISHSKSPDIYKKIISTTITYDLLDYLDSSKIPTAEELLSIYDGINITSPYKKHFISSVNLTSNAKITGAINCLKKSDGKIIGENTDYLAIVDILKNLIERNPLLEVVILGDGVMSGVANVALSSLSLKAKILSRKGTNNFSQLNLNEFFKEKNHTSLVINTCAREYVFKGSLPDNSIFWDFNYNFPQHSQLFLDQTTIYIDGFSMLERQAFYAVAFWSVP